MPILRPRHYVLIDERGKQTEMSILRPRHHVIKHKRGKQTEMSILWPGHYVVTHDRGKQTEMSFMRSRYHVRKCKLVYLVFIASAISVVLLEQRDLMF